MGDATGDGAGGGSSTSLVLALGLSRGATSAKLLEQGGWRGGWVSLGAVLG